MPQEFHIVQCFSCSIFQVDIKKKSHKWQCKMCGAKQSLMKIFGEGPAKDCRKHVQALNERRANLEEKETDKLLHNLQRIPEIQHLIPTASTSANNMTRKSKWSEFMEDSREDDAEESGNMGMFTFERVPKKRKSTLKAKLDDNPMSSRIESTSNSKNVEADIRAEAKSLNYSTKSDPFDLGGVDSIFESFENKGKHSSGKSEPELLCKASVRGMLSESKPKTSKWDDFLVSSEKGNQPSDINKFQKYNEETQNKAPKLFGAMAELPENAKLTFGSDLEESGDSEEDECTENPISQWNELSKNAKFTFGGDSEESDEGEKCSQNTVNPNSKWSSFLSGNDSLDKKMPTSSLKLPHEKAPIKPKESITKKKCYSDLFKRDFSSLDDDLDL